MTAVWPGNPYPRGATWDGEGVNFSLFSENATKVELCLFDATGRHEVQRIALHEHTDQIWHCYLPEARPGMLYGYRCHGPYDPERGHRFNPHKLLIEPYARLLSGPMRWSDAHYGYDPRDPTLDLSFNKRDSAAGTPKCRVIDPAFTWGDDRPPHTPWHDTVIYEVHVRGMTMRHPQVPAPLRGTYAGLATAPVIDHLRRLGVTAVELMPVHAFLDDRHLVQQGLRNYWGYNTIGFLAPEMRYSASGQVDEFKTMVKSLHSAGIEVILDVVYNHTAEGNERGPTLSFRGIDNAAYYRLLPGSLRHYMDFTGTGNTLNLQHPRVLQLIMDSLRYWVLDMHADGFRFDLAPTLARQAGAFDKVSAFLDMVAQDPVVSRVKLTAEPWDVGQMDSYDLGRFPPLWREWNGKYRDTMRDFWRSTPVGIGEFATRFAGSSDLYGTSGRRPTASVNLITVHDGFTMRDLVSYDDKHNEANGENNRDGTSDNRSWNGGTEGPTADPGILSLRARQARAMLTTLMLSFGVPLLLGGDEMGRTQQGNNNAYCQDNEITWFDWASADTALKDFTKNLIALRRTHPVFRRRRFLTGVEATQLQWFTPAGTPMDGGDWADPGARAIAIYLDGSDAPDRAEDGTLLVDDDFLVLVNSWWEPLDFALPDTRPQARWRVEIDSYDLASPPGAREDERKPGDTVTAGPRSVVVLRSGRPG